VGVDVVAIVGIVVGSIAAVSGAWRILRNGILARQLGAQVQTDKKGNVTIDVPFGGTLKFGGHLEIKVSRADGRVELFSLNEPGSHLNEKQVRQLATLLSEADVGEKSKN
jgi:alkyl hydroperoxide reductase subunit AhpF